MDSARDEHADKPVDYDADHVEHELKIPKVETVHHPDPRLYIEALERYPNDDSIDQAAERRLKRKLDMRILPLLGICYFFYVCVFPKIPPIFHHRRSIVAMVSVHN